eukprot:753110-Hanusia_phi.AAC.1
MELLCTRSFLRSPRLCRLLPCSPSPPAEERKHGQASAPSPGPPLAPPGGQRGRTQSRATAYRAS